MPQANREIKIRFSPQKQKYLRVVSNLFNQYWINDHKKNSIIPFMILLPHNAKILLPQKGEIFQ